MGLGYQSTRTCPRAPVLTSAPRRRSTSAVEKAASKGRWTCNVQGVTWSQLLFFRRQTRCADPLVLPYRVLEAVRVGNKWPFADADSTINTVDHNPVGATSPRITPRIYPLVGNKEHATGLRQSAPCKFSDCLVRFIESEVSVVSRYWTLGYRAFHPLVDGGAGVMETCPRKDGKHYGRISH